MSRETQTDTLHRRTFLGSMVAASATVGSLVARGAESATPEKAAASGKPSPMPKRKLGKTGLTVSTLCIGSVDQNSMTRAPLGTALAQGVTMIDTAEGYAGGNSEIMLGKSLKELGVDRKKLVIVTKTHGRDPKTWKQHLEASLQRMQIDYVDCYYMHGLGDRGDSDPAMHSTEEVRQVIADLKNRGMMKHFGFSSHVGDSAFMHDLCKTAAEGKHVEVCMLQYNFRRYEDQKFSADLDTLHKAGIGVIAMKTQGGASSTPERVKQFISEDFNQFQAAVRWALSDERISAVCSAMRNVDQVKQNATAAKNPMMSRSELHSLYMYALATHGDFCQQCQECTKVCPTGVSIPEIMRYHMYHANYGLPSVGREHYAALPAGHRADACVGGTCDLCEAACPHDVRIRSRLKKATEVLV